MFKLRFDTPAAWTQAVMNDFDRFLQDHAAAEKKASGMALSMLSHYSDKRKLVRAMTDLALEEMIHFKQVMKLILDRGITIGKDGKDLYVKGLRELFRNGTEEFFLDRLLVGAVIEARGYERFSLVAAALSEGKEKEFYQTIARSEEKHAFLFVELAYEYFEKNVVDARLDEILDKEAQICANLPIQAALH